MPFTACHFLRQSLIEGDEDDEETHDSDEEEESVRYARANNQGSVLMLWWFPELIFRKLKFSSNNMSEK